MANYPKVLLAFGIVATITFLLFAVACSAGVTAPSAPTSTPEPTANLTLRPTDTPIISTPVPTSTPVPRHLQAVDCGPDCDRDYEPPWDYVEWMVGPRVSSNGVLTLSARIDDGIDFILPGRGSAGFNNISLTDRSDSLYGSVVPPNQPGWDWTPRPGLWIANEYRYSNNVLSVRAQIDPAAANHPGLRLCLWSGGETTEQNQLLDCKAVQQP